jgi:two-component system, OmpR family, heavy metal sensor histidine kinase CusS
MSITKRLVFIYMLSIGLILGLITGLLYLTLQELSLQASHPFLMNICVKNLFYGLWGAAGVSVIACYVLAKQSLAPIKQLASKLDSVGAQSLDFRLAIHDYPKEIQPLAITCNDFLSRIDCSFNQISQFSARVAHELRNPVHMLKTATEVTLLTTPDIEIYQALLERNLDEFHHLDQLIQKLLLLSRCEHKQLALACEQHTVSALLDSVLDYYALEAEDKKIALNRTGDALISVDPTLFRQVLSNLLDNSLRHTQAGGEVKACVSRTDTHVNIRITDTGEGIPEEHLPHITQGFYQFGRPKLDKSHLGLGLAIARGIIQSHGGVLTISSQKHKGTVVTISLPNTMTSFID